MYQNCFGLQLTVFTNFGFIVKKRFGSCIQSTSNATHNLGIPVVLKGELSSKRVSSYACIFCAILNNLVVSRKKPEDFLSFEATIVSKFVVTCLSF